MSKKTLKMPSRATADELQHGLSPERLAELEEVAANLKRCARSKTARESPLGRQVEAAVELAAEEYQRSVETYRRNFCDLARAAGWPSRSPEDYLRGRRTGGLTERTAMRLSPETKAALDDALAKWNEAGGAGHDDFIAAAASRYLRTGKL